MLRRGFIAACLIAPAAGVIGVGKQATQLEWRGTAKVYAGGRTIDLGVHTTVEPFRRARSESWLLSDGPAKTNVLVIEPASGAIVRQGRLSSMSAAAARHERQQYGLYGYMLRGLRRPLRAGDIRLKEAGYPPIVLHFDQGRLAWADYTVDAPEGGRGIAQRITFAGQVESGGIVWPRRLMILQNGAPYFDLTLAEFNAR